jgi:hypothetical protein
MKDLSPEINLKIATHVSIEDIPNLGKVNKYFNSIISDEYFWRCKYIHDFNQPDINVLYWKHLYKDMSRTISVYHNGEIIKDIKIIDCLDPSKYDTIHNPFKIIALNKEYVEYIYTDKYIPILSVNYQNILTINIVTIYGTIGFDRNLIIQSEKIHGRCCSSCSLETLMEILWYLGIRCDNANVNVPNYELISRLSRHIDVEQWNRRRLVFYYRWSISRFTHYEICEIIKKYLYVIGNMR